MIFDNDDLDKAYTGCQAKGASGEVDTGRIESDASLYNSFLTLELSSAPTEPIDTSGLWYDIEEGRYVEESPGTWVSRAVQGQTHQQGVGSITRNTSVESALHFLPKSSDSGDDGWTDENIAELEKELGLALGEQQVGSSSACTPTSPSPRRPSTTGQDPESRTQRYHR